MLSITQIGLDPAVRDTLADPVDVLSRRLEDGARGQGAASPVRGLVYSADPFTLMRSATFGGVELPPARSVWATSSIYSLIELGLER